LAPHPTPPPQQTGSRELWIQATAYSFGLLLEIQIGLDKVKTMIQQNIILINIVKII
jgi:hypothetical protein